MASYLKEVVEDYCRTFMVFWKLVYIVLCKCKILFPGCLRLSAWSITHKLCKAKEDDFQLSSAQNFFSSILIIRLAP